MACVDLIHQCAVCLYRVDPTNYVHRRLSADTYTVMHYDCLCRSITSTANLIWPSCNKRVVITLDDKNSKVISILSIFLHNYYVLQLLRDVTWITFPIVEDDGEGLFVIHLFHSIYLFQYPLPMRLLSLSNTISRSCLASAPYRRRRCQRLHPPPNKRAQLQLMAYLNLL